jgi:hypothetical protein
MVSHAPELAAAMISQFGGTVDPAPIPPPGNIIMAAPADAGTTD